MSLFRPALVSLCLFGALVTAAGPDRQPFSASEAEALLPADKAAVEVMAVKAPPRMAELTRKLLEAAGKDPGWWLGHVRKAKRGEPLPYDAKMGLTKEEYAELLRLGKELTLSREKTVALRVTRKGDRVAFDGGKTLPDLKGVEIDLSGNTVRTPYGVTDERSRIRASEGQKLTGPWDGVQWKLEKEGEGPGMGTVVKLALGRLKGSGRGIFSYEVKQVSESSTKRVSYLLLYDLKPRKRPLGTHSRTPNQ